MTEARQNFRNDTERDIFIYLEPWAWRYRLRPGDLFELRYDSECDRPNEPCVEINVFIDGEATGLQIFANGKTDPEARINGRIADEDYDIP